MDRYQFVTFVRADQRFPLIKSRFVSHFVVDLLFGGYRAAMSSLSTAGVDLVIMGKTRDVNNIVVHTGQAWRDTAGLNEMISLKTLTSRTFGTG